MPDMNIAADNSGSPDGNDPNPVRQFLDSLPIDTKLVAPELNPDVDDVLVAAYVEHRGEMTAEQVSYVMAMVAKFSNWRAALVDKMLATSKED